MDEIEAYLEPYPPPIRALCNELRMLIKEAVPGAQEALKQGWQLIGYRTLPESGSRYFCFIAPYDQRVRLGFEWGVLLADEAGLLADAGSQVRSLYLDETADLSRELLAAYIREAAAVATLNEEQKVALTLQRAAQREQRA